MRPADFSWAVYRVVDGRAALTRVEVGHRNQDRVEILAGVGDGEQVVLHPSDRVTDDVRLETR